MSSKESKAFHRKAEQKPFDLDHRKKINFNIGKYEVAVAAGLQQYKNVEDVKQLANTIKWEAIEHLDKYLLQFEKQAEKNGAKVLWATDADEALGYIGEICTKKRCKMLVKSKSMVTEEIHLNAFLQQLNIESVETDLGEYIQQLDGEPPYHIVTPAMHKSKEDVAQLFAEKLGVAPNLSPSELTLTARRILRKKYAEAEIGVTGANFIIADTGSIALTENEGNARLSTAFPKTHIVIAGIEKVLPSMQHLSVFWPLLSTFGTGQKLTVYNSIISGPRQSNESDGPEEMYIILLDNGRTKLLADAKAREALYCIRCGACLNACPVYKNIGGHAYNTTYSGPIGSVITPHLKNVHDYNHLSYASSLCGRCTEVCPVKINIHELLLYNRKLSVQHNNHSLAEVISWKAWKKASLSRAAYNAANGKIKSRMANLMFNGWNKYRSPLVFAPKTFNEMWKEHKKGSKS